MKQSAGLLIYKRDGRQVKVLLGHMGGPFFAKKDDGAWDIPKGEFTDEEPLAAARREFEEEIGQPPPAGNPQSLGQDKASGKLVMIWAIEGGIDVSAISSNTFELEWPPKSGQLQKFPEIDEARWFEISKAMKKVVKSRRIFLERLAENLQLTLDDVSEPQQTSLL